ncbi:MAG TPA: hypothetical protein VMY42_19125 [Thermoguttaceae bacterium]|nr:hypothetical protein [Thermoguttaceae bacterium]
MRIVPYRSFGKLQFGDSTREDCVASYGEPKNIRTNREGAEEYHYEGFIVRFNAKTNVVRECTLLPRAICTIEGIAVTWDPDFLRKACEHDGDPKDVYGFIVLKRLGIAITGIHDWDESQLAVTAFSEGDFDDLLAEASPFVY